MIWYEKGLLFTCQACHLVLHADLVGARNVALRTLLARHDWVENGRLIKAAQRRRYAELWWSPDTSLRALAGGF